MKLLKDLGMMLLKEDSKQATRCGLFQCSRCNSEVMRAYHAGMQQVACCTVTARPLELHGMVGTRPYKIWQNMKTRCYYPSHKSYVNYGGAGITVCPEWKDSFHTFWEDMREGYEEHLTIDRKDPKGNYCKENCRWIPLAENSGRSRAKKTVQLSMEDGSLIKIWNNAREAGLALGIDTSSIAKVCNGKKNSAGGFCWKN